MNFTSIGFALFFLVVAVLYYVLPVKIRWIWILLSGIFFYMYSKPIYIFIPFFIIIITYLAGIKMEKAHTPNKAQQWYLFAIIANVAILVFFKYTDFFTATAFDIINFTNHKIYHSSAEVKNPLLLNLVAPLGISYITFQAIGYLIEIKRGNHLAERNFGHFSTFLFFFPKTIAGPVERAHHFLPQLKEPKVFVYENISRGLQQILWGVFKKLVIADRLSIYINVVFGNADHHSGITLLVGAILYVFQMYADFSGYTDMALGFSKILGFDLIPNFNRPLLAKSVTEFWRKWHISLSTWFADYFYNPIAIAKRDWGKWSAVYAFFITFIVLGFWHGANWTFIIFGALQGLILTIEFFTRKLRKDLRKKIPVLINNALGIIFTFLYFAFSLIFFRAASVKDALSIIKKIATFKGPFFIPDPHTLLYPLFGIFLLLFVEIMDDRKKTTIAYFSHSSKVIRYISYLFIAVLILLLGVLDGGQFIYFQF